MQEQVLNRIKELISKGQYVALGNRSDSYWANNVPEAQSWLSSAANAIMKIAPSKSFYEVEINRLTNQKELENGITISVLEKVLGLLQSIKDEAEAGMLAKLEYQIFATAFDDFLDHASSFHRSGKPKEAAVLVSAVLEDTIKKIASKNGLETAGVSLEPLIDQLAAAQVFTSVKSRRVKAYAGLRNTALHAEWTKLDLKDIGQAIEGVRELLDDYL